MGGLKDFAITQYMTEISSVKVVTLTLGHPVVPVKEIKVKKDFQLCFTGQKAHAGSRNRSSSPWKLPRNSMKITRSSNFHLVIFLL